MESEIQNLGAHGAHGALAGILNRFGRKPTPQVPIIDHEIHEDTDSATGHGWTRPGYEAVMELIASARPWKPLTEPSIAGVPEGWIPSRWVQELRRMAEACRSVRPDRADIHERAASRIENILVVKP